MAGSLTRRTTLQILAATPFGSVPAAQAAPHADAVLVKLVSNFLEAGLAEAELLEAHPEIDCNRILGYNTLEARQVELLEAILSLQSETTRGLHAKARTAQAKFTADCTELAEALGASIAADIVRLFPTEMA